MREKERVSLQLAQSPFSGLNLILALGSSGHQSELSTGFVAGNAAGADAQHCPVLQIEGIM